MIGTTIGKYKIVEKVGHGGMGTVYRAIDETLDREVAIKVLNPDLVDEEALERFRAEAVTLAKLHHPRIATVYELARERDVLLMVMEFVTGETFEQLVNRLGPLPLERALTLGGRALEALQYAHDAGVIHRDLKPVNLMVTPLDDVKVMGFGIARVAGSEDPTAAGMMMGTPAYMAPEQIRGEAVDQRADLYAMAVVLYRLVTGRLPFKADTAVAMIHSQVYDLPTPLREIRADVPAWLDATLTRALAKAPADRFQTADQFRAALEQGLGGMTVPAFKLAGDRPDDRPQAGLPAVVPAAPHVPPGPPPARVTPAAAAGGSTVVLRKQHLIVAAGLLVLLLIGVGALAFVAFRRSAPPPSTAVATETTATPAGSAPTPPLGTSEPSPSPGVATPNAAEPTPAPAAAAPAAPAPPPPAARVARGTAPQAPRTPPPAAPVARDTPPPAAAAAAPDSPESPKAAKAARPVEAAPASFDNVKALVPDGSKAKERDVSLSFEKSTLVVRSKDGDQVIKSLLYRAIVSATYSESKRPRWNEAADVAAVPAEFGGKGFLLQRSRNWLTLQSRNDFVIVRLEKDAVGAVLPAIETHTGLTVQKPAPDE